MDDARRKMPKLKCPYCNKRVADLPSRELKNISTLECYKRVNLSTSDIVLECPHCHEFVVLRIVTIDKLIMSKHSS